MADDIRRYAVAARTTDTFGRVLCSARAHHFVADGPVENGCPGEELTPVELFLSGVASCGVELMHVLARSEEIPLRAVRVSVRGEIDRGRPVRTDVTLFSRVELDCRLEGVTQEQAEHLVERFKGR